MDTTSADYIQLEDGDGRSRERLAAGLQDAREILEGLDADEHWTGWEAIYRGRRWVIGEGPDCPAEWETDA